MKKIAHYIAVCIIGISLSLLLIQITLPNSDKSSVITNVDKLSSKPKNRIRPRNRGLYNHEAQRNFRLASLIIKDTDNYVFINGKFLGGVVDPNSLKKNIRINDLGLAKSDKIQFNKKGTMFRIVLNGEMTKKIVEQKMVVVNFKNVKSVDNDLLKYERILNIEINQLYLFEEDGTWYKY